MAREGYGREGFCSICSHPEGWRFVQGVTKGGKSGTGWNASEAREAAENFGFRFSRQTWYEHQKHVLGKIAPPTQAVTAVPSGPKAIVPVKKSSNVEFLETIRDHALARALNNPDSITVEQGLKATQILEGRKTQPSDAINVLIQFVTGRAPAVIVDDPKVVEGTARDVSPEGATV